MQSITNLVDVKESVLSAHGDGLHHSTAVDHSTAHEPHHELWRTGGIDPACDINGHHACVDTCTGTYRFTVESIMVLTTFKQHRKP